MVLALTKPNGSLNWYLKGSVRGIPVYESTRTSDADTAEAIRIIRERELLDESIYGKKAVVTFAQAVESYLKTGGSERYIAPIVSEIGDKKLRKITSNDLNKAARKLYPGVLPETLNRHFFTPFIAVWNHAVRNDWADMRLWERPRKPKGTTVRNSPKKSGSRPVSYDRAASFLSNMSPAPAMVMTALFFTGMRPIELFILEADDVNVGARWIVLRSSKTGEPRGVPMHEFLVPLFEAFVPRGGIVFRTHKGKPYPIFEEGGGQLKGAILGARKRLAAAGTPIDDISPYTARHSVSTQLVVNGVHPHIKDQILGHAADDMSRHYTHVPQAPLIEAINTIAVPDAWPRWGDPIAESREFVKWGKK